MDYLKIIFFKVCNVLPPESSIFVHWRPVKMAKKNFLLVLVKWTQFLDVVLEAFFQLVQSLQQILRTTTSNNHDVKKWLNNAFLFSISSPPLDYVFPLFCLMVWLYGLKESPSDWGESNLTSSLQACAFKLWTIWGRPKSTIWAPKFPLWSKFLRVKTTTLTTY